MRRNRLVLVLCVMMLFAFTPTPTTAQNAPVGWEMGFVYENGASEDNPFTMDETDTNIRFWIRNDNVVGDIEIALEYSITDMLPSQDVTLSGEESVTVGSGSNETFTLTVSGIDVWDIASGTIFDIDIDGELTAFQGIPLALPMSSQSIDHQLIVPELYSWEVDIEDIGHKVNAGSEFEINVDLINKGNTIDSISSFSLEDDCPVLTSDDDSLDAAVGLQTHPIEVWKKEGSSGIVRSYGLATSVTLIFDASSTHPTRICEIEITVHSTGVDNGGMGDASNKGELDIEVEARPVGGGQEDNGNSGTDDDGPQNQEEVTSENFLPTPAILTPLAILMAALMRAHEK